MYYSCLFVLMNVVPPYSVRIITYFPRSFLPFFPYVLYSKIDTLQIIWIISNLNFHIISNCLFRLDTTICNVSSVTTLQHWSLPTVPTTLDDYKIHYHCTHTSKTPFYLTRHQYIKHTTWCTYDNIYLNEFFDLWEVVGTLGWLKPKRKGYTCRSKVLLCNDIRWRSFKFLF